jgi:hypothetical protein
MSFIFCFSWFGRRVFSSHGYQLFRWRVRLQVQVWSVEIFLSLAVTIIFRHSLHWNIFSRGFMTCHKSRNQTTQVNPHTSRGRLAFCTESSTYTHKRASRAQKTAEHGSILMLTAGGGRRARTSKVLYARLLPATPVSYVSCIVWSSDIFLRAVDTFGPSIHPEPLLFEIWTWP